MKISHLKTNHIVNPLGFALDGPTFSWIVDDTKDTIQTAAQFILSLDADFSRIRYDSGKVDGLSISSLSYRPQLTLSPRTRYYWKVCVWGETEYAESEIAWFETSKMEEPWQAHWITPDFEDHSIHPNMYKYFELPAPVTEARAYICGLGLYHLELNEKKVGDEYLTPYCNAYDQWIQYQTFDVTNHLEAGANLISVMLGNGWYKGRYGANGGSVSYYGDQFALICEIHITLEDGSEMIVGTDTSWNAQPSPITFSDIFDGEIYDARVKKHISSHPEAYEVQPIDISLNMLQPRRSIAVRIQEEIKPIEVIHTPAGETVLDFGQNMTGWVRFRTSAPVGHCIKLQFGEILQEGAFFRDNLRTAKAEYKYIADGTDAIVEPYFTFYGFRYVKVSGWVGDLTVDDFTGCVVYSDMDIIGEIQTSNQKVNQLFKNVLWGQKGNFLDIPTDCPQRDERLGWTGDIQVFSGTACFNMDVNAFLSKYAYDLAQEQSKHGGMVPHIVPMVNLHAGGSCAWGDAATIVPWNLYEFHGDISILDDQFQSMCDWVDYIKRIDDASGGKRLWSTGFHFGDWLALDGHDPFDERRGGTPEDFIASAYYYYSARLVSQAALILGRSDVAKHYQHLSEEIKLAIQDEFFTSTGRLAAATQTGYVLALFMDLVPDAHRERVEKDFINKITRDNVHLQTGFVGTPYLCRVLSNIGANDLAYKLLLNEDYPSWLYAVNLGATTIWERWDSVKPDGSIGSTSMNSLNHYAYGSIVEWMYRDMCGLNPVANTEQMAGFRIAHIAPKPDRSLQWARASYRSAAGLYESGWRFTETGHLILEIVVPFNATAEVVLPAANTNTIWINGDEVSEVERVGNNAHLTLGAGRYKIEYMT